MRVAGKFQAARLSCCQKIILMLTRALTNHLIRNTIHTLFDYHINFLDWENQRLQHRADYFTRDAIEIN